MLTSTHTQLESISDQLDSNSSQIEAARYSLDEMADLAATFSAEVAQIYPIDEADLPLPTEGHLLSPRRIRSRLTDYLASGEESAPEEMIRYHRVPNDEAYGVLMPTPVSPLSLPQQSAQPEEDLLYYGDAPTDADELTAEETLAVDSSLPKTRLKQQHPHIVLRPSGTM